MKVPAADAKPNASDEASARRRGILDVRAFFHHLRGEERPDWKGLELLSYVALADGLYGAGLFRYEMRETPGRFASAMLVPRLTENWTLMTAVGGGDGADFFPLLRLDAASRMRTPLWPPLQVEVGGGSLWYTSDRRQIIETAALIVWLGSVIVEARQFVFFTDPGDETWRKNPAFSLGAMVGREGQRWILLRGLLGTEPENRPGVAFSEARDRGVGQVTISYRQWLGRGYGFVGAVEYFHQADIYYRVGGDIAVFFEY